MEECMEQKTDTTMIDELPRLRYSPSILFVDSSADMLSSLGTAFRNNGYALRFAPSGEEGLGVLKSTAVDVVVAGISVKGPGTQGFLKVVTDEVPDSIRVLLGGYEDKPAVLDAIAFGFAQYYLLNPWEELELKEVVGRAVELHQKLKTQNLLKVLNSFSSLPSPPRFQARMHELLNNTNKSLDEIVKGVEENPALVAKLLQVANSVYCGIRQQVSSVKEAIIFIGTEYVKSLVLALEVFQTFVRRSNPHALRRIERLWERSIRRAAIAKTVSISIRGSADAHIAYAAALFQDVGYLVRLCTDPAAIEKMFAMKENEKCTLHAAEVKHFAVLHDEIGAALLERWNFPREIVRCVADHHRESRGDTLVQAVQIAEMLDTAGPLEPHDPQLEQQVEEWKGRMDELGPFMNKEKGKSSTTERNRT
jgi:HD-like signal output (HDOD) protein/CheY-like chemotaxis protein